MQIWVFAAAADQTGRVVTILMLGLLAIAIVLSALTVWYWKFTDPERPTSLDEFEPVEVLTPNFVDANEFADEAASLFSEDESKHDSVDDAESTDEESDSAPVRSRTNRDTPAKVVVHPYGASASSEDPTWPISPEDVHAGSDQNEPQVVLLSDLLPDPQQIVDTTVETYEADELVIAEVVSAEVVSTEVVSAEVVSTDVSTDVVSTDVSAELTGAVLGEDGAFNDDAWAVLTGAVLDHYAESVRKH